MLAAPANANRDDAGRVGSGGRKPAWVRGQPGLRVPADAGGCGEHGEEDVDEVGGERFDRQRGPRRRLGVEQASLLGECADGEAGELASALGRDALGELSEGGGEVPDAPSGAAVYLKRFPSVGNVTGMVHNLAAEPQKPAAVRREQLSRERADEDLDGVALAECAVGRLEVVQQGGRARRS
jgi:hypothetical protein